MRLLIPLICIFFLACNKTDMATMQTKKDLNETAFPSGWLGLWEGRLQIFGNEGKKMEIPMSLEIVPIDSTGDYTWHVIYGEDKEKGLRPYRFSVVDVNKGHYVIDEDNGIYLDNYYFDGLLTSTYEVGGNLITCNNKIVDDRLYYEIIFGTMNSPRISGNQIIGIDTIPEVTSFRTLGIQKAILKRKKTLSNYD